MLDKLRGAYAAVPPNLRARISWLVALLPARYQYGNCFYQTQKDIERAQTDWPWLQQERLKRLRKLVAAACKAPYYQELFHEVFGEQPDPATFTFDDLAKLPVLSKNILRERAADLRAVPAAEADVASTSGSSGRPVKFWLDKDRGAKEFAYITHFWSRVGFVPGTHRRAVFRGVQLPNPQKQPWQWDAALRELRLSPFQFRPETMQRYCELIERYRIDYLHGYPSAIAVFAQYVLHTGWQPPKSLRGILPASEGMMPQHEKLFREAFAGVPIQKYYGMSEKSLIAAYSDGLYDFEPLYGHGELVRDDGTPCGVGETGRIVGTGFISYAMPLLRYDTEDFACLKQASAPDNGCRLKVSNLVGRWDQEFIIGAAGELIAMSAVNAHTEAYTKLHSFQLFQDTPGKVRIDAVAQTGVSAQELQPFVDELHARVGSAICFTLNMVTEIPFATQNAKRPFIQQRLDLAPYLQNSSKT